MDSNIPFIIKNVPYLWLDKNPSLGGVKGWNRKRFTRIYLVPPDQILYHGYLFPPKYCGEISEYFRGQSNNIKPINYHNIRLNGNRIHVSHFEGDFPISVLYKTLNLPFHTITLNNLQTITSSKTPVLVDPKVSQLKFIFPPARIDHRLLKITDVGLYSVTRWRETLNIIYEMKQIIKTEDIKKLTITDATAGVGGDTLCFALHFKKVNAVELVPLHCITISHNLSVYKIRKKVNLICANYVDVIGLYKPWSGPPVMQNVIYFDPPWGGPQYKGRHTIVLKLDNVPLSEIIWYILIHNLADYIFVKAPKNVNLDYFPRCTWVKIRNFKLICIRIKLKDTPLREKYDFTPYQSTRLPHSY